MKSTTTQLLKMNYGVLAQPGQKIKCPFCNHTSFSIKSDDSIGKCFYPGCEKTITGEGGQLSSFSNASMQPSLECKLEQYSFKKQLPIEFLKSLGLSEIFYCKSLAIKIPYLNENGVEVAVRFRTALSKINGMDNRFCWKKGSKPLPYGLWKLNEARQKGFVVLVEGESDCHTLWHKAIPTLGIPGANTWKEEWANYLKGIQTIFIVVEPDAGGDSILKWLSKSVIRDRVRTISLKPFKDPSELFIADQENFLKAWQKAIENSILWMESNSLLEEQSRNDAWQLCREIATNPSILNIFESEMNQLGVVGEERNAKILFLTLISRFLDRPISITIKGPSSCGKSYIVEQVLKFFPSTAYHQLTSMSEKALIYSEEPLSHRFLIICEASGLENDFFQYLVRSLLSEGKIRYETVENTAKGLKPRLIEKEGPTGLIMTTTALSLHPENETRIMSLPIIDSKEQTRSILLSLAEEQHHDIDFLKWHALHEWLTLSNHVVIIPFARKLAEWVPPEHVRLRRDFKQIINLIKSHAILHQANRQKNEKNEIIATLEDYIVVRALVKDLIGEGIGKFIPQTVRETIAIVRELLHGGQGDVKVKTISSKLDIDESATSRRVKKAVSLGYLTNLETQKYKPKRLVLGEPLPEDFEILPSVEKLNGCTVAVENGETHPPSPPEEIVSGGCIGIGDSNNNEVYPWTQYLKS